MLKQSLWPRANLHPPPLPAPHLVAQAPAAAVDHDADLAHLVDAHLARRHAVKHLVDDLCKVTNGDGAGCRRGIGQTRRRTGVTMQRQGRGWSPWADRERGEQCPMTLVQSSTPAAQPANYRANAKGTARRPHLDLGVVVARPQRAHLRQPALLGARRHLGRGAGRAS